MAAAESAKTTRHVVCAAMKLETGRAAMMPIMSPLDTMPTTRPRVASGGEVGGKRNEDLHCDRAQANQASASEKDGGGRSKSGAGKRDGADCNRR